MAEVESAGAGFLPEGKLKILFEGHQFFKYTRGQFAATHPTLCHKAWTRKYYLGGTREHERLKAAMKLDTQAALLSTSWGKFQIMGFNFALCGFKTVESFVGAMYIGEEQHLLAFVEYIKNVGLADELRAHNWDVFARRYNGPLYKKNRYAEKLAAAFAQFSI